MMDARQSARTLIVTALKSELLSIQGAIQNTLPEHRKSLDYLITGCGLPAAQQGLSNYLSQTECAQVVNFGTAGAIAPQVRLLDLVTPTAIMTNLDGRLVTLQPTRSQPFDRLAEHHGWRGGVLFSSAVPITAQASKEQLRRQTAPDIVDMEAFALLQVCRQYNLPFYCLKVVTDYALENSETEFQQNLTAALTSLSAAAIEILQFIFKSES